MWGHFKDGVLEACDEMCGEKERGRSKGDTWRWNEEVKEAVSRKKERKKEAHKAMCQNSTEENKRYKGMKNKANKSVREKAEEVLTELQDCPNGMIRLVKD